MSLYRDIKCVECNESFQRKHHSQTTCSKECRRLRKNRGAYNKEIKCRYCGKITMGQSLHKYCGRKCFYDDQKIKRKGKSNPSYRSGAYCKGKKKLSHKDTLFRKNSKKIKERLIDEKGFLYCEHCGVTSTLRWEVHHIYFRSEKPKHENLHHERNLLHLCIKCHNLFHKKKSIRLPYVKERKLEELYEHLSAVLESLQKNTP